MGKKLDKKHKGALGNKSYLIKTTLVVFIVLAFSGVFLLGINIGNGRINFKSNKNLTGLPAKLDYSSVDELYSALKSNYYESLSEKQILDGIKHGLASSTNDPYTEYFTAQEAADFNNEINQSITGIGAQLGKDSNGNINIIAPILGSPAAAAGIQSQDVIESINGVTTSGMSVDEAVSKIRGKAGTKVDLVLLRNGQSIKVTITRAQINIPSVTSKILDGNIGYIQISTFADDTTDLVKNAADNLKKNNVKGVILDLRNDPGGLVDAAVNVSSLWLPSSDQVLTERRGGVTIKSYDSYGTMTLANIPTVVLINSGSASASEITTAALRDNNAAYVIGQKSYGKGVVQQLINLQDGSQLKVTVASWYRPNGQNINKKGITPDKTVTPTQQDLDSGNDTQLNAALSYLGNK